MSEVIRQATIEDSAAILRIYAYYVENTAISFETAPPTLAGFQQRIANLIEKFPYLVFLIDNEIVGYAYAAKYAERAAYRYDVEVSVYTLQEYHGRGIAGKLYNCLFRILSAQGFYNAYALIALPNEKSERFHEKFAFTEVGVFHNTGYKFGLWHDVMHMEKAIKEPDTDPAEIKPIAELAAGFLAEVFSAYTS